jgi:hypothetical protein
LPSPAPALVRAMETSVATAEFDFTSSLPPEKVMGALLDFSKRRPELWAGLAPKYYEVYEVGDTSAFIREGSGAPFNVWARERYDWSTPWQVAWTVEESNFCTPGDGVVVSVTPADGGSNIHLKWERRGSNLKGRFVVALLAPGNGRMLKSFIKKGFDSLSKKSDLPDYTPPATG